MEGTYSTTVEYSSEGPGQNTAAYPPPAPFPSAAPNSDPSSRSPLPSIYTCSPFPPPPSSNVFCSPPLPVPPPLSSLSSHMSFPTTSSSVHSVGTPPRIPSPSFYGPSFASSSPNGRIGPPSLHSSLYRESFSQVYEHIPQPTCIVCCEHAIFVGCSGINSSVYIWEVQEEEETEEKEKKEGEKGESIPSFSLKYVGELMYMCCSVSKMKLSQSCTKLAVITQAGCVYIWDVSRSNFEEIRKQNELTILQNVGGFLPSKNRVGPIAFLQPNFVNECIALDFAHDAHHTVIGVGKMAQGGVNFYSGKTLEKICVLKNLYVNMRESSHSNAPVTKLTMYEFNCIAVDTNKFSGVRPSSSSSSSSSQKTGRWIAAGDGCGNVCAFYICENLLNKINYLYSSHYKKKKNINEEGKEDTELNCQDEFEAQNLDIKSVPFFSSQICEKTVQINDICWRPRGRVSGGSMYLIAACSDGFLRFCGFDVTEKNVINKDNINSNEDDNSNYNYISIDTSSRKMHILRICRGDCIGELKSIHATAGYNKLPVLLIACNSMRKQNNILSVLSSSIEGEKLKEKEKNNKSEKEEENYDEDNRKNNHMFYDACTIEMTHDAKNSVRIIGEHEDYILGAIFSPKGAYAVSISSDKCIQIYSRKRRIHGSNTSVNINSVSTDNVSTPSAYLDRQDAASGASASNLS